MKYYFEDLFRAVGQFFGGLIILGASIALLVIFPVLWLFVLFGIGSAIVRACSR